MINNNLTEKETPSGVTQHIVVESVPWRAGDHAKFIEVTPLTDEGAEAIEKSVSMLTGSLPNHREVAEPKLMIEAYFPAFINAFEEFHPGFAWLDHRVDNLTVKQKEYAGG